MGLKCRLPLCRTRRRTRTPVTSMETYSRRLGIVEGLPVIIAFCSASNSLTDYDFISIIRTIKLNFVIHRQDRRTFAFYLSAIERTRSTSRSTLKLPSSRNPHLVVTLAVRSSDVNELQMTQVCTQSACYVAVHSVVRLGNRKVATFERRE